MAPTSNGSEVVQTWTSSSCATGDYYLRTADGTIWKSTMAPAYCGTGQTRGDLRDGKVYR